MPVIEVFLADLFGYLLKLQYGPGVVFSERADPLSQVRRSASAKKIILSLCALGSSRAIECFYLFGREDTCEQRTHDEGGFDNPSRKCKGLRI